MPIIVKSLGILIVCFTAILIFSPETTRKITSYFREGKRLYWVSVLRFIVGIFLLIAAFQCAYVWVVFGLGVLFLISASIPLFLGLPRMATWIDYWMAKPDKVLRFIPIAALVIGAALIYAA